MLLTYEGKLRKKYLKKGDIVVAQNARCRYIGATDNPELELDGFPGDADLYHDGLPVERDENGLFIHYE